jgi:hypothetical protein
MIVIAIIFVLSRNREVHSFCNFSVRSFRVVVATLIPLYKLVKAFYISRKKLCLYIC